MTLKNQERFIIGLLLLLLLQAPFMVAQAQSSIEDAPKARRWSLGAVLNGSLQGYPHDLREGSGRRVFCVGGATAVHFRVTGPLYLIGGLRYHQGGFAIKGGQLSTNIGPDFTYDLIRFRRSSLNLSLGAGGAITVSKRLKLASELQFMRGFVLGVGAKHFYKGEKLYSYHLTPNSFNWNLPIGTFAVGAKFNLSHGLRLDLMPYFERELYFKNGIINMNGFGIQAGVFYTL
jgi:hypothetical protein